jgi:ribonuclease HI
VGEFLAIVHALALLEQKGLSLPVYSDSATAIAWVKAGKCKTDLLPDGCNASLFELIVRAEAWLAEHQVRTPVYKWDTEAWGENPADFNRK